MNNTLGICGRDQNILIERNEYNLGGLDVKLGIILKLILKT
jgi:hypothetical protein